LILKLCGYDVVFITSVDSLGQYNKALFRQLIKPAYVNIPLTSTMCTLTIQHGQLL